MMKRITNSVYVGFAFICLFSTVVLALDELVTTYGNIAVGKFYKYNYTPNESYPDRWANKWCSGAKLTDEDIGETWSVDQWVGWFANEPYTLEIEFDLMKEYLIDELKLHLCSRLGYAIEFPDEIRFYYRQSIEQAWQQYGAPQIPGADTSYYSTEWFGVSGDSVQARYLKYELDGPVGVHLFISEVEAYGQILNSWKAVPDWGCYHGAYPSSSYYYLQIRDYESVIQKQTSMTLWYAKMGTSDFKNYLGILWTSPTCLRIDIDYSGARYLQVGWEPEAYITAEQVAGGYYDGYFETFFLESIDYSNRLYNTDPVWLRPMSEMNGGWTFPGNVAAWGGDPLNFRRAWRRMYNIAEQIGATDHHIFLWSPNGYTYNGDDHTPDKYYPGDQYVDWVGVSIYVQGDIPYPNNILTGTAGPGSFDFYGNYSYKPMMFSEGAYWPKDGVDGEEWINQWFDVQYNFPKIKSIVWFYIHDADYNVLDDEPYMSLYRNRIAEDYFLRQSVAGRLDFNKDFKVNLVDFAEMASNWSLGSSNLFGDVNGDNSVDMRDLTIFSNFWLQ